MGGAANKKLDFIRYDINDFNDIIEKKLNLEKKTIILELIITVTFYKPFYIFLLIIEEIKINKKERNFDYIKMELNPKVNKALENTTSVTWNEDDQGNSNIEFTMKYKF